MALVSQRKRFLETETPLNTKFQFYPQSTLVVQNKVSTQSKNTLTQILPFTKWLNWLSLTVFWRLLINRYLKKIPCQNAVFDSTPIKWPPHPKKGPIHLTIRQCCTHRKELKFARSQACTRKRVVLSCTVIYPSYDCRNKGPTCTLPPSGRPRTPTSPRIMTNVNQKIRRPSRPPRSFASLTATQNMRSYYLQS